jgi:hypothetical protein
MKLEKLLFCCKTLNFLKESCFLTVMQRLVQTVPQPGVVRSNSFPPFLHDFAFYRKCMLIFLKSPWPFSIFLTHDAHLVKKIWFFCVTYWYFYILYNRHKVDFGEKVYEKYKRHPSNTFDTENTEWKSRKDFWIIFSGRWRSVRCRQNQWVIVSRPVKLLNTHLLSARQMMVGIDNSLLSPQQAGQPTDYRH